MAFLDRVAHPSPPAWRRFVLRCGTLRVLVCCSALFSNLSSTALARAGRQSTPWCCTHLAVLRRSNLQVAERAGAPLRLLERHSVAVTAEDAGTSRSLLYFSRDLAQHILHSWAPDSRPPPSTFRAVRTALSVCTSRSAKQKKYVCMCVYVCMYVCMYVYIYIYTHICVLFRLPSLCYSNFEWFSAGCPALGVGMWLTHRMKSCFILIGMPASHGIACIRPKTSTCHMYGDTYKQTC